MSNEEKKEIKELNNFTKIEFSSPLGWTGYYDIELNKLSKDITLVLNLIKNKKLKNLQNDTNRLYTEMIERKNYFERELQKLKDKIKAKIEVLEKLQKEFPNNDEIRIKIIAYKELLEKE